VADLVIQLSLSCISGDVKDANGLPVPNVVVFSSKGGFVSTNGMGAALPGAYQIFVPENTSIKVFTLG
jgi:hypothetical protein